MSALSKFEATMQGIVEGSFGRVFRSKLQPVELSGKLTRAMEDNLQVSADRRIAPNIYDIYLSQRDYDALSPTFDTIKVRLAEAIIAVARERAYMLSTRPMEAMECVCSSWIRTRFALMKLV